MSPSLIKLEAMSIYVTHKVQSCNHSLCSHKQNSVPYAPDCHDKKWRTVCIQIEIKFRCFIGSSILDIFLFEIITEEAKSYINLTCYSVFDTMWGSKFFSKICSMGESIFSKFQKFVEFLF